MKAIALFLVILLCLSGLEVRARDARAQDEIDFLIRAIETSGAQFVRNGSEYSAKDGAAHMRDKLNGAGERVQSAEDFISGVASKSMITGRPYLIHPPGGKEMPVGPWLSETLAKYRAGKHATR